MKLTMLFRRSRIVSRFLSSLLGFFKSDPISLVYIFLVCIWRLVDLELLLTLEAEELESLFNRISFFEDEFVNRLCSF